MAEGSGPANAGSQPPLDRGYAGISTTGVELVHPGGGKNPWQGSREAPTVPLAHRQQRRLKQGKGWRWQKLGQAIRPSLQHSPAGSKAQAGHDRSLVSQAGTP